MQFGAWKGRFFIIGTRLQRLGVIVIYAAAVFTHHSREHIVDVFCNLFATSEVFIKIYFGRIIIAVEVGKVLAFLQKYFRHGKSEAVYALLNITDNEKIFFVIGYCSEKHILRLICILILIYEYFGILMRKLFCQLRSVNCVIIVSAYEQSKCHMRNIGKVIRILFFLKLGIMP